MPPGSPPGRAATERSVPSRSLAGRAAGMTIRKENDMQPLAFTRSGTGAPLVLLHGIGLTRQS